MSERAREQVMAMSATGRFALLLLGVVVLFMLWTNLFGPWAAQFGDEADAIEAQIAKVEQARIGSRSTNAAILAHGPLEAPGARDEGSQDLIESAKGVMAVYGITDYTLNESGGGVSVRGMTGSRIERIKADLAFNAANETAIEIIADLEADPAVESIEGLRLTRGKKAGTLDVALTAQAWVRGKGRGL
jgi:hypothetical protein